MQLQLKLSLSLTSVHFCPYCIYETREPPCACPFPCWFQPLTSRWSIYKVQTGRLSLVAVVGSLLCRVLASLNILFGVMMSKEDKEIPIIDDDIIIEEGLNKNLSDKKARAVEVLEQQM